MAVDVNSNKYTFGFAAIMVVVVASLLALASESLKPMQKANVSNEKRQNILKTIGIEVEANEAEAAFKKYLKSSAVLDASGKKKQSEITAFDIDVLKEYKGGLSNIYKANKNDQDALKAALKAWGEDGANYPVYVFEKEGEQVSVVPVVGTGLWGPIWGYMAIGADGKTVVGAVFDHKSETPGLGAEINQASFQKPFEGKTIFDEDGVFTGIKVMKGGAKGSEHGVDAISGGTITSNGVTEMILRTLKIYEQYFVAGSRSNVVVVEELPTDSTTLSVDSLNVEQVADSLLTAESSVE